jgi:hypothetical protein
MTSSSIKSSVKKCHSMSNLFLLPAMGSSESLQVRVFRCKNSPTFRGIMLAPMGPCRMHGIIAKIP